MSAGDRPRLKSGEQLHLPTAVPLTMPVAAPAPAVVAVTPPVLMPSVAIHVTISIVSIPLATPDTKPVVGRRCPVLHEVCSQERTGVVMVVVITSPIAVCAALMPPILQVTCSSVVVPRAGTVWTGRWRMHTDGKVDAADLDIPDHTPESFSPSFRETPRTHNRQWCRQQGEHRSPR